MAPLAEPGQNEAGPPHQSLPSLFVRFLWFGALAWGGPVAQIGMLRSSLVDEQHWISLPRFNRTLAVYQVLPGPEAQELAVFFGMVARGRIGGLLAGLGFMLPGFVLMLALSWLYVASGLESPVAAAAFAGCQAAVVALVLRGLHRIGERVLGSPLSYVVAILSVGAGLAGVPFVIPLAVGGLVFLLNERGHSRMAGAPLLLLAVAMVLAIVANPGASRRAEPPAGSGVEATPGQLLVTGLKGGALTFGGAYTSIPFVRNDAVGPDGWMSDGQFLDGLALAGIIPAPLVIFATFVGFVGGGIVGATAITLGMFLPAFAITMLGHGLLERVVNDQRLHALLDGITAAVIGLVAATALQLAVAALTNLPTVLIFGSALAALYLWRAGPAGPVIILGAAAIGVVLLR
jgi:chromate transporter